MSAAIRIVHDSDMAWMHALNQANKIELADETPESFAALWRRTCLAMVSAPEQAFFFAFNQKPRALSPNWDWLAARLERFVYLDRIAVAPHARGQGVARAMYERLFVEAASLGAARIACEVNRDPPNPASEAFHAALGFSVVGEAALSNGKQVRYFTRELSP
jgi:uncharacterized protein